MDSSNTVLKKSGILYPIMLIAAVAVIIFSVIGIATMTGYMPNALSKSEPKAIEDEPAAMNAPAATPSAATRNAPRISNHAACADCAVVESIGVVESKGHGSGLGAVAGGVIGGILGNQIGRGGGRTAMTVVGAGAGAFTGNEVEKNINKSASYQVRVRMNDGAIRTFYQSSKPAFQVGQKVRVTDQGLTAAS